MKGIYKNIVLPFMVILLTGCSTDSGMDQEMGSHLNHKGTVADIQTEDTVESTESEGVEPENTLTMFQPSDQFEDIIYDGEIKNLQGAVAGREHIFLYGYTEDGAHHIYIMKNGETTAVQSDAEWNEDEKRIRCMAADESGKCYVLMMSVSEDSIDCKTTEIMVIETDGKVAGTIDISNQMKELDWKIIPDGISIDKEGNIYLFSEADKYSVTIVNKDGEILGRQERKSEWYIEGIGRGRDGAVYIVYSNADEYSIGKIETNGEVMRTYENVLPEAFGKYKYIFPGTDSNLLIYGKAGIYAYTDGTKAEERVAKGDMDFNAEAKVLGFLADGRLVLSDLDEEGIRHFFYIPTVK